MSLPPPPPPPLPPSWGPAPTAWLTPPPPPPSLHPPPPRWAVALGIVLTGVLVLGLVAVATRTFAGDDGPGHPDEWDPRVADLAAFVEEERGLEFDHPVYVDFLSAAAYTDQTTDDEASVPSSERDRLERFGAELRALGVGSGELDLFTALNQVSDGGTLAFYDATDQRVRVRGTKMTVGLEVTIVHELTHALQDQHFDLERLYDQELDSGAATAFRGLAEGDALRVEDGYLADELTEAQRQEYDDEYAGQLADSELATADVPPFVSATFGAPYALGRPFTLMLTNRDGNDGVDRAFDEPPTTEEHLFDPTSFLAEEGSERDIELGFSDDADLLDEAPFGATSWYLFLAERIDPKVAFEAALGWNGDHFAAVERDGTTCVRAAFAGDTEADEEQMAAALTDWLAAMPGDQAELTEVDHHPVLEACDPGEDLDLELTGRSETSLYLPSLWGYLVADAASVVDPDEARCYARAVIRDLSYDEIIDPEGAAFAGDAFQATLTAALDRCRT
jgi:hypothetical protein